MCKILLKVSCIWYIASLGTCSIKMCYFRKDPLPQSSLQCDSRRVDRLNNGWNIMPRTVRSLISEGSEGFDIPPCLKRSFVNKVEDSVSYLKVRSEHSNSATRHVRNGVMNSESVESPIIYPEKYEPFNKMTCCLENSILDILGEVEMPIGYLQKSSDGFGNEEGIGCPLAFFMKQLVPHDSATRHVDAIVDYDEVECPIRYLEKKFLPSDVMNGCIGNADPYCQSECERPMKQFIPFEGMTENVARAFFEMERSIKDSQIRAPCPIPFVQKRFDSSISSPESVSRGKQKVKWWDLGGFNMKAKRTSESYDLRLLDNVSEGIGISTTLGQQLGSSVTNDSATSKNNTIETSTRSPYKIVFTVMPNPTDQIFDLPNPELTKRADEQTTKEYHPSSSTRMTSRSSSTSKNETPTKLSSSTCGPQSCSKKWCPYCSPQGCICISLPLITLPPVFKECYKELNNICNKHSTSAQTSCNSPKGINRDEMKSNQTSSFLEM